MRVGSFVCVAFLLCLTGCSSKGTYVSGVYDPDLEYAPGQCTALTKTNIDVIKKMNLVGKRYVYYCKICNDKEPVGPYTFGTITYVQPTKISWFFGPDKSRSYDAANIYVETSKNKFYNLAKLVGCPAKASTEITWQ